MKSKYLSLCQQKLSTAEKSGCHNASIAIKIRPSGQCVGVWIRYWALQSDTIWPSTSAQTDGKDEKKIKLYPVQP